MTGRHREPSVVWVPVWVTVPTLLSTTTSYREQQKIKVGHVPDPDVNVWRLSDKQGLFYVSRFHVDADGAPNAYHPHDKLGLDELSNAGYYALVRNRFGRPVIQTAHDPFPGFYISTTSLQDSTKQTRDTSRYVDSRHIPYIVLPLKRYREWGVQLGDLGVTVNLLNGKRSYVIFADEGPTNRIGEGSIALANALGINPNPRSGGLEKKEIFYLVFPGSGQGQGTILTVEEINRKGAALFATWGGLERVKSLSHV